MAMTGIAYGTSRITVSSQAVGSAETISCLLGQEVQAGHHDDHDEQPECRLVTLEEAGLAAPVRFAGSVSGRGPRGDHVSLPSAVRSPGSRPDPSSPRFRPPVGPRKFTIRPEPSTTPATIDAIDLGPVPDAGVVEPRSRDAAADGPRHRVVTAELAVLEPGIAVGGSELAGGPIPREAGDDEQGASLLENDALLRPHRRPPAGWIDREAGADIDADAGLDRAGLDRAGLRPVGRTRLARQAGPRIDDTGIRRQRQRGIHHVRAEHDPHDHAQHGQRGPATRAAGSPGSKRRRPRRRRRRRHRGHRGLGREVASCAQCLLRPLGHPGLRALGGQSSEVVEADGSGRARCGRTRAGQGIIDR